MTRLFLRFYFGVIIILMAAWLIQAYVFRRTTLENNIGVIEEAFGGGARLARIELAAVGGSGFAERLAQLQLQFDYPISLIERNDRPTPLKETQRLDSGEVVLFQGQILTAVPKSEQLLVLGPLPAFAGPSQRDISLGLGSVLLLVASAIAVLLRPLATQLRSVENAALAIAGGDLGARIDTNRWGKRSVPLTGAFNSMADRVEQLLRSQKELLQAVSHELRTPLARIKFATELIETAENAQQRHQRIAAIDDATDQLDELVGELLTYVRLDEGSEQFDHEDVVLADLLAETVANHAPLYSRVQFDIDIPNSELHVVTYRNGLQRAVGNLVSNAGKYSQSKVMLSAREEAGILTIAVDDDGPGIAAADREKIFEPFRRLDSNQQPGTGLGLALVRRICRRLGGEVSVSDSPLGGARFAIALPTHVS